MNHNVKGLMGALVTGAVGVASGYVAGAINNPKPPVYREPEPICGCNHHRSYHDDKGCHATETHRVLTSKTDPEIEQKRDKDQILKSKTLVPAKQEYVPVTTNCGCKSYDGPDSIQPYIP